MKKLLIAGLMICVQSANSQKHFKITTFTPYRIPYKNEIHLTVATPLVRLDKDSFTHKMFPETKYDTTWSSVMPYELNK